MKKTCLMLTAMSVLSTGSISQAQNISTVEGDASGTKVSLTSDPIITAIMSQLTTIGTKTYTSYAILATDGTGSVELFGKLPVGSSYVPTVGDALAVSGTYSPFDGIPEIETLTAISAVSTGNTVPTPPVFTIPQLNVATLPNGIAGYLVELDNVTIEGATGNFPAPSVNTSYTIEDASANSMALYDWTSSYSAAGALGGTPVPTGPVDILGLMSVFNGTTPQLVPYSITPVPEPSTFALAFTAMGGGVGLLMLRRRK